MYVEIRPGLDREQGSCDIGRDMIEPQTVCIGVREGLQLGSGNEQI